MSLHEIVPRNSEAFLSSYDTKQWVVNSSHAHVLMRSFSPYIVNVLMEHCMLVCCWNLKPWSCGRLQPEHEWDRMCLISQLYSTINEQSLETCFCQKGSQKVLFHKTELLKWKPTILNGLVARIRRIWLHDISRRVTGFGHNCPAQKPLAGRGRGQFISPWSWCSTYHAFICALHGSERFSGLDSGHYNSFSIHHGLSARITKVELSPKSSQLSCTETRSRPLSSSSGTFSGVELHAENLCRLRRFGWFHREQHSKAISVYGWNGNSAVWRECHIPFENGWHCATLLLWDRSRLHNTQRRFTGMIGGTSNLSKETLRSLYTMWCIQGLDSESAVQTDTMEVRWMAILNDLWMTQATAIAEKCILPSLRAHGVCRT